MMTTANQRITARTVTVVASLALLAACSGGDPSEPPEDATAQAGGDLVMAVQDDPVCLDPQQVTLTTALNIGRQLTDSLLDQDPETGEIVPWLAEGYETNDDLTEFTFTLRDGVTFSDDTPLTADTVVKNFDALSELGSTAPLASQYLAGYSGAEAVDESTVRVTFEAPNAAFLQGATTITLGLVSDATTELSAEERCQQVVGTGPFVLDSYTPNNSVEISKREGYDWASELREHEGEAYLDTVTFPVVPENGVRAGGLGTGEFDMIQTLPAVDEPRFTTDEYRIYARANPGVAHSLVPNTERPIVSDPAVREAMILGTDREEFIAIAGWSQSVPASGPLTSATPGFVSQAEALTHDPEQAAAVLEDAGWVMGADGVREKDGEPLTVSVTAFYGQDILESVQAQLAEIGLDLQINSVTAGEFFGAIAEDDYDFLGAGLTQTDPDVLRAMFSVDAVSPWAVVDDPELEEMLQEQTRLADPEERQQVIADIQAYLIDNAYIVPLFEPMQVHASVADVSGLTFDSSSRIHLYDVRFN